MNSKQLSTLGISVSDDKLLAYYQANFQKYGIHENSLGWTKGKQNIRFHQLTKPFSLSNRTILDIGCGFGDLLGFFKNQRINYKNYIGIDLIPEFVEVAQKNWSSAHHQFILGNYLEIPDVVTDFTIASGIFGHRLYESQKEQYEHVTRVLEKAMATSSVGVSFDFISDKTDFSSSSKDFHASPEEILKIAYGLTRNVVLDNSALPFEFSITLFKNQKFETAKTVFECFLEAHPDLIGQE
jgi:ubiquinone/menaquinone biosynthesis C-methylase UbiE